MHELAVVCAYTGTKAAVKSEEDLPDGWLSVPAIRIDGNLHQDLHFSSWDALSKFAQSQGVKRSASIYRVPVGAIGSKTG